MRFRRLKRASSISNMIIMVWMCLAGGYTLLRIGEVTGWAALAIGLALLGSPYIPFFRWYWRSEGTPRAYPAIILIANTAMIVLTGFIALVYLRDPFLTYNAMDTLTAVVFVVATVLSLFALAVNVVALTLDLRTR